MTLLGIECIFQTSWLVDKRQESNALSLLRSFVVWVWLAGCWFGGIFEVFEFEIVDPFRQLPYPGSSFQLVDSDTLSSLVSSPMKSSVTYVYFERYECDNFALENFIIINISAAILQVSLCCMLYRHCKHRNISLSRCRQRSCWSIAFL